MITNRHLDEDEAHLYELVKLPMEGANVERGTVNRPTPSIRNWLTNEAEDDVVWCVWHDYRPWRPGHASVSNYYFTFYFRSVRDATLFKLWFA